MGRFATFALHHAYLLLFGATLVEQLGLPLPVAPLLLGCGALARSGELSLGTSILVYCLASSIAHMIWFEAGRVRGASVLRFVCKISLEPDTCVRRTQNLFSRYGAKLLLAAPFTPGLGMVAPPLAGLAGMTRAHFIPIDLTGSIIWSVTLVTAGWFLGPQLNVLLEALERISGSIGTGLAILFVLWLAWKLIKRRRLFNELRIARITAQQLLKELEEGKIFVVDLRHEAEVKGEGFTLPGALRVTLEDIEARHVEIPRDRDVALFCS
ncbi:MAG TPA: DedA family protein [Myxococcales bacterium]|jgi:membrane protein DedA with SNARE-associated domain|nr:DedA family protein [Myxococcales bacterium]